MEEEQVALTRKLLTALGIEAEKVEEIITAHTETVDALKEQRDAYKADAEKLPTVQKELDELKEAAEKNANDPYKAQYEKVKADFDQYKKDVEAQETKRKKVEAYKALLKEAGVADKHIEQILKVSDVESVELDKDGKVKDAESRSETIKKEWSSFIATERNEGANTSTPPGNNGGGTEKQPSMAAQIAKRRYEAMYGIKKGE